MDVSEEYSGLLFENNPQPMYLYDLESLRFLAVNEAALRQYGYSRDEFLSMTIEQIRPVDEMSRLKEYLRDVPEGYHMAGTWRHRRKDGTAIAVETAANTGMFGGRRARLVVATDVTDRRRAQESLRDSEAFYHSLVEALPQSIFRKDAAGRFTFANQRFCELIGKPAEAIIGKTDQDLYPAELAEKYRRDDRRVMEAGETFETVEEHVTPRGTLLYVRVVKTPVKNEHGQVVGIQGIFWDETDRRRIEDNLRESEELFRRLSESSPLGIALMDPEGHCTYTNVRYRAIFGVTFMESLAEGWTRWIHPEDRPEMLSAWFAAIHARREFVREFRLQLRQGVGRWVELRASAMRDDRGQLRGHVATAEDITERKQREQSLHESEERFRTVARATSDVVWDWNLTTNAVWLNENIQALFGYRADQVRPDLAWRVENLHPSDQHRIMEGLRSVIERGEDYWSDEYRFRRGDGSYAHVLDRGYVMRDSAGRAFRMIGAVMDITQRRAAEQMLREREERFRSLSACSPMGIFMTDVHGDFTYTNPRCRAICGFTFDESLGQSWLGFVHSEDRDRVITGWQKSARAGRAYTDEFRFCTPEGAVHWVNVSSGPMLGDDGELIGHVGTIEHITERKRAEEEIRSANERLQSLSHQLLEVQESERRALARELHDEIGQALTATKINLQTALRFPDPAAVARSLHDSIALVSGLLQQVRTLSLNLHAPMLDDLGLAAALRWYVDQQAQRAGLRARFLAEPAVPRLDSAVETACFRVAQEAVTNVVRHAGASTVSVELHQQNHTLHLIVRDDGKGFDVAGIQERPVEQFSLGWLSMQERAALVGGRLEWESAPSHGTTVHAYFPLLARAPRGEPLVPGAARKVRTRLKSARRQIGSL